MEQKIYILIGGAGGYVSGGVIYHRNKALFMKERGWIVHYISCCHGKVYVDGLETFIVGTFTFLVKNAFLYPERYRKKMLDYIIRKLPNIKGEIVIETGTDCTAYWGELLAERLQGKHIVTLLDEYNENITSKVSTFYQFKYERKELACISDKVMVHIFGDLIPDTKNKQYSLGCYCSNSLYDIHPDWISDIPKGDLVIGYIGRLEKKGVSAIVEGLKCFASENKSVSIVFLCIGGSDTDTAKNSIISSFTGYDNIKVYVTGLIFPIPVDCVKRCDLIFGIAGSSNVGAMAGVPTVHINQITDECEGFITKIGCLNYMKCDKGNSVCDYIKMYYFGHTYPLLDKYDLSEMWKNAQVLFDKHLNMLDSSIKEKEYFNFNNIKLTFKERMAKYIMSLFGMKMHKILFG